MGSGRKQPSLSGTQTYRTTPIRVQLHPQHIGKETNLAFLLDRSIVFAGAGELLVPFFSLLLDPTDAFLGFLPLFTVFFAFFFGFLADGGREGITGGRDGRDSFIAFLSSGVR